LLEYAQERGVFEPFVEDRVFVAPDRTPFELLRFAALAMLQGPDEHVPYGWTHCLTLAQAPLLIANACTDPGRAAFVSIAYLAAHWAGLGAGAVENWISPRAVEASVDEALSDEPSIAAAAAGTPPIRHARSPARHLGIPRPRRDRKYTLACLDAAAADPVQRRLYLAAALSQRVVAPVSDTSDPLTTSRAACSHLVIRPPTPTDGRNQAMFDRCSVESRMRGSCTAGDDSRRPPLAGPHTTQGTKRGSECRAMILRPSSRFGSWARLG
jgi:hypothetical protein